MTTGNPSDGAAFWSPFRIIAHRGASAAAPENTLAAITRAAAIGARSVELDVMLSSDGVPVIIHDTDLARTTNGTGPVAAQDYESLARLDAGSWFDSAFADERIPALAAAVSLILDKNLALNLEIKPSPGEDRATAARAIDIVTGLWPDDAPLVLSSASRESLRAARAAAPHWPRGLIADIPPSNWRDLLAELDCVSLHCAAATATPSLAEQVHGAGYRLLAYTINRPAQAAALFKIGVDGIFTDDPAVMLAEFGP